MSVASWCSTCFCVVLCVGFWTGNFVMVPLNLPYLHCLQHSLFEHLLNLYFLFFIYNFLSDFSKTCWVPALVRSMNFIGGNQHIARQTCTIIFEEEKRTFSPISVASPAGRISRSLVKAHESMMVLYWSGSNSRPNRILSRSVAFCIHACWATYAVEPYIEYILYVEL